MQIIILGLLAIIALLIGSAVYLWRTQSWRNKKQWIVMLIVLAAALQPVIVTMMMTSQRLAGYVDLRVPCVRADHDELTSTVCFRC